MLQIVHSNPNVKDGTFTATRLTYLPEKLYRVDDSADWHWTMHVIDGTKPRFRHCNFQQLLEVSR